MAGLYIHVPFCHSKCIYCDFYSTPGHRTDGWAKRFVDSVICEWNRRKNEIAGSYDTIYIGGGTPSILPGQEHERLISSLGLDNKITEFTVEVNPEDVTPELLTTLRNVGVNRLSMGIQSFDDRLLAILGRRHKAHDAVNAIDLMRQVGFQNISGDIIYGLPGQSLDEWKRELDRMMQLNLPHISAYLLSYESGTRLTLLRDRGELTETDEELANAMYSVLTDVARDNGYEHYEISNFAKPGHRAVHNSNYWEGIPYLGLGPGAHSWDGNLRRYNPSNLTQYVAQKGNTTCIEQETETERINDDIVTGLRTADGLNLNRFDTSVADRILSNARSRLEDGTLVLYSNRHIAIPERFMLISDLIIVDLLL